jgi:hypothetical protein
LWEKSREPKIGKLAAHLFYAVNTGEAGGIMRRALQISGLVLSLSLAAHVAAAQTANSAWQATPASVLKTVLRNVVAAQDKYRTTHSTFAGSLEVLRLNPGSDVKVHILAATGSGWRAKATHRARPGRSCVVFVGKLTVMEAPRTAADGEMAGEERVPLCDRME